MVEASWGSGLLRETSADTLTFSTYTPFIRAAVTFMYDIIMSMYNPFKSVTGAPGVAPVAGKPGLTMGIMGAPGAPALHRGRRKEKRDSKTQCRPSLWV